MGREDAVSFLQDAFTVKFHAIKIIKTIETKMKSIMLSLKYKILIRLCLNNKLNFESLFRCK
jgi:hypothetical protein